MDCFREVITTPPTQTQEGGTWLVLPAHARSWLVYCLTECGAFDEGLALGTEAVRLAEAGAFPTSQCAAYASLAEAFLVRGAFPSAIALLERGLAICRRWHNWDWFPEYAASLGLAYAQGGHLAEALPLLGQAVAQEATMGGGHGAIGLTALSHGLLLAGRLEAARTQAKKALRLAQERQERGFQAWALRLLGEIAAHGSRTCALRIMFWDLSPSGGMACISRRSAFDMCFQDPLPPCWPAPEHTSAALFTMINRCLS
jgi:tetratricopeptide (TPR) repeat protein